MEKIKEKERKIDMLNKELSEKISEWSRALDDIKQKIVVLDCKKTEAKAAVQVALKEKNVDEVILARQTIVRIDEEIEALKLIETEVKNTHPVDHETFQKEYRVFLEQNRDALNKKYEVILEKLIELEDSYVSYESTYHMYVTLLRDWQKLAGEIGLPLPSVLNSDIQAHRGLRNDLRRLISTTKGGTI